MPSTFPKTDQLPPIRGIRLIRGSFPFRGFSVFGGREDNRIATLRRHCRTGSSLQALESLQVREIAIAAS